MILIHMVRHIKHPIYRTLLVLCLITLVAIGAIAYGRGYRITKDQDGRNIVAGTGLLVLTSTPDGARAFIDGELSTATDNTVNLKPGMYKVKIEKDGYFPWEKDIEIKNERVTETNALLFPTAPQLTNLTTTGASKTITDKERKIIAYTVASASSELNGIYIMNLNRGILPIGDARRQIANNLIDNFSQADLEVSPDGLELLATIQPTSTGSARTYLLNTNELNASPLLVTSTADEIRERWQIESEAFENERKKALPRRVQGLFSQYFENPLFSPEEDKVLYTASISASLPLVINPPLPSTNSTPEVRDIIEGNVYVYNIKDDKNYLLRTSETGERPDYIWNPSNSHLYFVEGNKINSVEYDGFNNTTVYAGPFLNNFLTPSPDGTGIVILTSFNDPTTPPNLYRVIFR